MRYRLIPAAPLDPEAVEAGFLRIASRIQERTGCDRIAALQKAADGYPDAYRRYCAAMTETCDGRARERVVT